MSAPPPPPPRPPAPPVAPPRPPAPAAPPASAAPVSPPRPPAPAPVPSASSSATTSSAPGVHKYQAGERLWIPDKAEAWLIGTVINHDEKVGKIEVRTDKEMRTIVKSSPDYALIEPCGSHIDSNIENLVDLDELSEGAILHHVRKRFVNKLIYTYVGAILVAVNPFENLPIYGPADVKRCSDLMNPKPHVFVTGAVAYQQLQQNRKNQSVLISGESGAGKTETTKKVLNYLSCVAPAAGGKKGSGEKSIEDKILQSNPLLEAMGNAKTKRNNNSSRFGKWMKVYFDNSFRIQGCEIVNYLLEKSRVVFQNPLERNYHIFYQLLAGAETRLKARLQLKTPADYHYLDQSNCVTIDGVDDRVEFLDVLQALETLQFNTEIVDSMMRIFAGILHLGNVLFESGNNRDTADSRVTAATMVHLHTASEMFGVDPEVMKNSLIGSVMQSGRGSIIRKLLSPEKATETRDTVAKALYGNLFDYVIKKVNLTLRTENSPYFIGILDIFGFEIFEINSFEQLCINYANEKLQFHFNEVIFSGEMTMYAEEGIPTDKIEFEDNGMCVNLIEAKGGLISLLEDECSRGGSDEKYMGSIDKQFGSEKSKFFNPYYSKPKTKPNAFIVRHFAGAVEYTVSYWLDKNKDLLSNSCKECLALSSLPLVSALFTEDDQPSPAASNSSSSSKSPGGGGGAATLKTLGTQFKNQLVGLVTNLRLTEPLFIRCVKPNHEKVPSLFTGELALRQLRYAGLFEAIRIRKSGYAYRVTHEVFANSYSVLAEGLATARQAGKISVKDACAKIFQTIVASGKFPNTPNLYQIGNTKVFIKTNTLRTILDRLKADAVVGFAITLQSVARGFIARMRTFAERYALERAKRKLEEELKKKYDTIVCIQKYARRYLVKKMLKSMKNLIELRKALTMRDARKVQDIIERIETSNVLEDDELAELFKKEVQMARAMMRLIKLQDSFADSVEEAIRESDVPKLNSYLIKAEKMEMTNHPVIFAAKQELQRLHRKRRVIKNMIDFLHNETGNTVDDRVAEMIIEARTLGVDADFVGKVQRVFDAAGPRLRVRNRLRRGVETVDKFSITHALLDAHKLRIGNPGFAEVEIRAANAMLHLLKFDKLLHPNAWKTTIGGSGSPGNYKKGGVVSDFSNDGDGDDADGFSGELEADGPRISAEMLVLCDRICACTDPAQQSKMKQLLKDMAVTSEQLEIIIRSYKWSKSLSVWKYPEILETQKIVLPEDVVATPKSTPAKAERNDSISGSGTKLKGAALLLSTMGNKRKTSVDSNDPESSSPSSPSAQQQSSASAAPDTADSTTNRLKRSSSFSRLSMSLLGGTNLFDEPATLTRENLSGLAANGTGARSPSTVDALNDEAELDFYGLKFSYVRSNPYIIRQLHKDFDPVMGEAPASIKAAMSAPDLPPMIKDSLKELECLGPGDRNARQSSTAGSAESLSASKRKAPMPTFKNLGTKELKFTDLPTETEQKLQDSRKRVEEQRRVVKDTTNKLSKTQVQKKLWK